MEAILLSISYLAVLAGAVTGVVRLISPDNAVIRQLHAASSPFANFVFAIYFLLFQFSPAGPLQRVAMALCFMALAYTGFASGKKDPTASEKRLHIALGLVTFLLFSFIYFSFILIAIGPS
ncbi:MAG: hypothetical protein KJ042_10180 [Deltaproteobacteria bacterium]|nr:hypothetical protein [Deltaproteobacteria bacterium]